MEKAQSYEEVENFILCYKTKSAAVGIDSETKDLIVLEMEDGEIYEDNIYSPQDEPTGQILFALLNHVNQLNTENIELKKQLTPTV
jgi:hypothetical protein